MWQNRLHAHSVRLAQLVLAVYAWSAFLVLLPTPTAQRVTFARLVDTALLEPHVKHALILSMRPARLTDALPTIS